MIVAIALAGLVAGLYPMSSQWLSSYNQSRIVNDYTSQIEALDPSAAEQLALAREYNDALSSGVLLSANAHVPEGDGQLNVDVTPYRELLRGNDDGLMGRVRIPSIKVDLPIYHGTSESTLLRGAGHLEGSHLPVGGESTHSVITAHRGLANSTMFTNLDQVDIGDTFTLEVLGEVLTYEVTATRVVNPEDTDTIRPVIGEDLVTLVTCTPLGVNTHRILVTGERIIPTPTEDLEAAGSPPDIPGFPWWAVWAALGLGAITSYLVYSGHADARTRVRRTYTASGALPPTQSSEQTDELRRQEQEDLRTDRTAEC